MNLPFMKQFPWGPDTRFREKVLSCLLHDDRFKREHEGWIYENIEILSLADKRKIFQTEPRKLHTIRVGHRWKPGHKIHFRQWAGKPYKSKCPTFAPVYTCIGTQKIVMKVQGSATIIFIDELLYATYDSSTSIRSQKDMVALIALASNDGFEQPEEFFSYFTKDFEGQIIHWTDHKYSGIHVPK